jgi:hypothetical protein
VQWETSNELAIGVTSVRKRRKHRLKILFVGPDDERVVPLAAELRRDHVLSLMQSAITP